MPIKTDVVVVGAGAAGLAAARELRLLGIPHVVVEAKPIVGGRTFCDETTLGFPYDLGGFWISNDGDNLLVDTARELGFDTSNELFPGPEIPLLLDRTWETKDHKEERLAFNDITMRAIGDVNLDGSDCSIADLSDTASPYFPLLASWLTMLNGLPMEQISAVDQSHLLHGDSVHQVREGMGNLVKVWSGVSDVLVNSPVRAMDWSPTGVELEISSDTMDARAVIMTASVGVLASDAIDFRRPLPDRVPEALDALPMGVVNRIALRFDGDVFGDDCPLTFGRYVSPDDYIYVMTRLVGENVALGYVGNTLAKSLEQQPDQVAVDLLCDALELAIGTDVRERITAALCTRWLADPWSRGSYAAAVPGGAWARETLRQPWDNSVYLAGEATSATQFSLVHGAINEGIRVTRAIRELL